ncbi:flippase [Methylotenera versatilis]|uniref:flippase n=1 Tax=Methylotenera versatilis TaxID=1055487 RepID=UPI00064724D8|nr:flippase [Methylotenera versatilis]
MHPLRPSWLRYLPVVLRKRLGDRPNLQKAFANTGWLFLDRILRMGVGLLVGVWVARYLGPEQFGLFNYAVAFVAIFGAVATLGLNGIVLRDLVKDPQHVNTTLGTTFLLQLIGGVLAFFMAVIAIGYIRPEDAIIKLIVAVLGFGLVFKAAEVVKYWFESQVQSKYVVWVENIVFLIFSAIKIALILNQATLIHFVWMALAEIVLVSVALLGMYMWRESGLRRWKVERQRVKTLIKDSWPLLISALAIMAYTRIDQIMLGQMLGNEAVGIYSAAVRISEVWYFVPLAIIASVFPSIIEAKNTSEALYYHRLQKLFDVTVWLGLLVAIPMTFLSDWVVLLLFGEAYRQAGPVLAILIWASVFVGLGFSSGRWFVNEGHNLLALKRNLMGLTVNVLLNIYLIPLYGPKGAALATLLSCIMVSYLSDFFSQKSRVIFLQKTRALFFLSIIKATVKDEN